MSKQVMLVLLMLCQAAFCVYCGSPTAHAVSVLKSYSLVMLDLSMAGSPPPGVKAYAIVHLLYVRGNEPWVRDAPAYAIRGVSGGFIEMDLSSRAWRERLVRAVLYAKSLGYRGVVLDDASDAVRLGYRLDTVIEEIRAKAPEMEIILAIDADDYTTVKLYASYANGFLFKGVGGTYRNGRYSLQSPSEVRNTNYAMWLCKLARRKGYALCFVPALNSDYARAAYSLAVSIAGSYGFPVYITDASYTLLVSPKELEKIVEAPKKPTLPPPPTTSQALEEIIPTPSIVSGGEMRSLLAAPVVLLVALLVVMLARSEARRA